MNEDFLKSNIQSNMTWSIKEWLKVFKFKTIDAINSYSVLIILLKIIIPC